ncbi:hypothetical protein CAS74_004602 [Pichia kudriavzevii]|uniref:DNA-binding protein RAP1 n=1 Tax=Pichia kudriavzevii TaxID=4909 RepID=A0A099P2W4_PICKU|nr:hypothetical protein JL09_g1586 [Pichia kudriavzevii]OUT20355.1 hypothetical protein CAS74_004602 [Pichia kudriavzevii]
MAPKTDIFVDAGLKPYNFFLCPPLDRSERLIRMIKDNGGEVVQDFLQNCIIISSRDYKIPEELKSAHIYSYEVIQDSANRGAQQEFSNYLIHIPDANNDTMPHQFHDDNAENVEAGIVVDGDGNYDFENLSKSLVPANLSHVEEVNEIDVIKDLENNSHLSIDFSEHVEQYENTEVGGTERVGMNEEEQQPMSNVKFHPSVYDDYSVRYFTDDEDKVLMEEIRKRHWMGIKGHLIYEAISELPYFKNRRRTSASLRERMRTLKFNLGYVYQVDKNHNLLRDEKGNYIKTTKVSNKLIPYNAEDDMILAKTVYQHIDFTVDEQGFEIMVFPTNFYDKFASVYDNHPAESWRQRLKNYIIPFGIVNYLKYYILEMKQGRKPLPTHKANKEWLQARKHIRKTDCPRLYFPNVPLENDIIDENLQYLNIKEANKEFNYTNPFRELNKRRSEEIDETNPSIRTADTTEVGIDDDNNHDNGTKHANSSKNHSKSDTDTEKHKQAEMSKEIPGESSSEENKIKRQKVREVDSPEESGITFHIDENKQKPVENEQEKHQQNQQRQQPYNNLFQEGDRETNQENSHAFKMEKQSEVRTRPNEDSDDVPSVFIDEPTYKFTDSTFAKSFKKLGPPMELINVNKDDLIDKINQIFEKHGPKILPRLLSKELSAAGINEYYTVFLIYRCNLVRDLVLKSLINYIRTDGKELLIIAPGVWSDKGMEYFEKKDPRYDSLLISYHGEKAFKRQCKWRQKDKKQK